MATVATIEGSTIVGDHEDQLVTMIVDKQLFGIPILQVQDIVEASKITPVPLAPSAIAGVLNLRGRIVTVIDLRKLLGNNEEVPWNSQMGVTVEYKNDLYTLLVDAIGDVRTLPKRDFDSAPSTMEDNVRKLCAGIYRLRGNLLVVLDVSRILNHEVIEATPMLSVEERRTRKDAAKAAAEAGGESQQLSTLMTDLNSYETEAQGVFGAGMNEDEDDIKARKRANRSRRPVGERWQEVLDEKARQSGKVAYRMREPHEETVETARDEAVKEDEEWASRVVDPTMDDAPALESFADLPESSAWDDGSMPPATDDMPAMTDSEPEAPVEEASGDMPEPFDPELASDAPFEDLPFDEQPLEEAKTDIPETIEADIAPEEPVEEAPIVEEAIIDIPEMFEPDIAAEEAPVEEAKTDIPETFEPDIAADEAPLEEPAVEEAMTETADPFTVDDAVDDIADDTPVDETVSEAPESEFSETGTGKIASGWWNKLRSKKGDGDTSESDDDDTPEIDGDDSLEIAGDAPSDDSDTDKKAKAKKAKAAKKKAKSDAKSKKK